LHKVWLGGANLYRTHLNNTDLCSVNLDLASTISICLNHIKPLLRSGLSVDSLRNNRKYRIYRNDEFILATNDEIDYEFTRIKEEHCSDIRFFKYSKHNVNAFSNGNNESINPDKESELNENKEGECVINSMSAVDNALIVYNYDEA